MAGMEIDLNPVDFITIGTIGPKGMRVFYLQAGYREQIITMVIEKEQSWALSEAINEMMADLDEQSEPEEKANQLDMDLREPIEPVFRVSQMGLGYDEDQDKIILVAQELVTNDDDLSNEEPESGVVRMWCSRDQILALSQQAIETVESGRADPKQNGRLVYYWT